MAKLWLLAQRGAFFAGLALAVLAVVEGAAELMGHSLIRYSYTAGRLLEFATMLMVFAIALEIRAAGRLKP